VRLHVVVLHDQHVVEALEPLGPVGERLLGDQDARAGVLHLVLDLLRRVGVVERERRRAEVQRRRVEPVKFGAVREHDRHR
jgi:hypothetical protein